MGPKEELPLDLVAASVVHTLGSLYGKTAHDVLLAQFGEGDDLELPEDLFVRQPGVVSLLGVLNTLLVRCGLQRVICLYEPNKTPPLVAMTESQYREVIEVADQNEAEAEGEGEAVENDSATD